MGWIRKADRSEALLPSIDEQMGDVLLRIFGGATDGPPDQFTARSLLRAIAAGMIARCSPALSRGYGANSGANSTIAINFVNNSIFENMEEVA